MIVSIEAEGLETHINRYFKQQQSVKRFQDVIALKNMRIAGKPLSIRSQAAELGLGSRNTLYTWHRLIEDLGL